MVMAKWLWLLPLLLAGCAHDVVLKPAAIRFGADADTATATAVSQYDAAIATVNADVGRFLVSHPECGLTDPIARRDTAMAQPALAPLLDRRHDSLCLNAAERAAIDRAADAAPDPARYALPLTPLPFVSRADFAPQFQALALISRYVGFLAEHADAPDAEAAAAIRSLSAAMQAFAAGLVDFGVGEAATLSAGGPAQQFIGHFAGLAERVETMAGDADDVAALQQRIRRDTPAVAAAIRLLAADADLWSCAIHLAHRQRFAELTEEWNRDFATMDQPARTDAATRWVEMHTAPASPACDAIAKGRAAVPVSAVGQMMTALADAALDLNRIAERRYRPAERQRIVEATLARLGALMQAAARFALPLF